jgi:hypothetical protein
MRWLRVDERDVSNIIGANPDVIKSIPVVKYRKKGSVSSISPYQNQPQEIAQPSVVGPHPSSPIPPPKPARLASPLTSPGPSKPTRNTFSPGPPKPPRALSISSMGSPSYSPTVFLDTRAENEIELDEDDAICVICLNRYVDGENLRRLHCLHHFHKKVWGRAVNWDSVLMNG